MESRPDADILNTGSESPFPSALPSNPNFRRDVAYEDEQYLQHLTESLRYTPLGRGAKFEVRAGKYAFVSNFSSRNILSKHTAHAAVI